MSLLPLGLLIFGAAPAGPFPQVMWLPVPEALELLGIHVEMLEPNAVAFGDLSKFNAIIVGLRAYELRRELPGANQRLLDYVSNGELLQQPSGNGFPERQTAFKFCTRHVFPDADIQESATHYFHG